MRVLIRRAWQVASCPAIGVLGDKWDRAFEALKNAVETKEFETAEDRVVDLVKIDAEILEEVQRCEAGTSFMAANY